MMAPAPAQPMASTEEQAELLRVLGHPMRLAVLKELTGGERSVGDVAERTGLGLSVLSQQLAILRKAGLVRTRRDAKLVFYSLAPEALESTATLLCALSGISSQATPPETRNAHARARGSAATFARIL